MDIINYYPHDLNTRFHACITYSKRKDNHYKLKDILRLYHISKASLMRWMKRFDGTKESLKDKSKRPITPHPNSHTSDEIKNINNLLKRNPNIGLSELYGKLRRDYAYTRHPASLFRFLRKMGILTTNQPFSKWGEVFGDPVIANAIIDRLVHHCELIKITGMSYRIKDKNIFDDDI